MAGDYDIALRHNQLGLDDVVVNHVDMFRMERMSDDVVWLACYFGDQVLHIDLWVEETAAGDPVVVYAARNPLPAAVYERG